MVVLMNVSDETVEFKYREAYVFTFDELPKLEILEAAPHNFKLSDRDQRKGSGNFPVAAILAQQQAQHPANWRAETVKKGSRIRLLDDEDAFRASFQRFPDHHLNGLNDDKLKRRGKEATVSRVFGDETINVIFDDGVKLDFPFETVAAVVAVAEPGNAAGRGRGRGRGGDGRGHGSGRGAAKPSNAAGKRPVENTEKTKEAGKKAKHGTIDFVQLAAAGPQDVDIPQLKQAIEQFESKLQAANLVQREKIRGIFIGAPGEMKSRVMLPRGDVHLGNVSRDGYETEEHWREGLGMGVSLPLIGSVTYQRAEEDLKRYFGKDAHEDKNADTFVVHFCGHGVEPTGEWSLQGGRDMYMNDVLELWNASVAKKRGGLLVIVCDSCHSGAWVRLARDAGLPDVAVQSACSESEIAYAHRGSPYEALHIVAQHLREALSSFQVRRCVLEAAEVLPGGENLKGPVPPHMRHRLRQSHDAGGVRPLG